MDLWLVTRKPVGLIEEGSDKVSLQSFFAVGSPAEPFPFASFLSDFCVQIPYLGRSTDAWAFVILLRLRLADQGGDSTGSGR